jgi:hypothetical protein
MNFGLFGRRKDVRRASPTYDQAYTGATSITLSLGDYGTHIKTSGAGTAQTVALPSGEYVGQRKLVILKEKGVAGDSITFTMSNIEENLYVGGGVGGGATALTMNTAGQYVLLEWSGAKWQILYNSGTLTT